LIFIILIFDKMICEYILIISLCLISIGLSLTGLFVKEEFGITPLIYVLTRTSNRPCLFKKCAESVKRINKCRHIVSCDNFDDLEYIRKYIPDEDIVIVYKEERLSQKDRPENLYFNEMYERVPDYAYIVHLDDDAEFVDYIPPLESNLIIWKAKVNGKKMPKDKKIVLGNIDSACFAVKAKLAKKVGWRRQRGGDYDFLSRYIEKYAPKITWSGKTVVKTNEIVGGGNRVDRC
jgi:hypothetical protein